MEIEEQIAEGDLVAPRWTCTGKRVRQPEMDISRVSDGGKVVETWEGYNSMVMMQQLGVVPSPEEEQAQA